MTDSLSPRTADAVEFLQNWDPTGPWTVVAIRPSQEQGERPHVRAASFTTVEPLYEWIDGYNGRWNLYFVPNRCDPSVTTSPERHQMTFMRCFHLDLDLPKGAEGTAEEYAELLARIKQYVPQPHAINFSGGGYQSFWQFDEQRAVDQWLERVEECNKTILKQVGGDGSCWNANRLMRLPGTINMLNYIKRQRGRQPALAYNVESTWAAPRWSFEKDVLPRVPNIDIDAPTVDPQEGVDTQPNTIENLPPKLRKAIQKGDASAYANDRSKLIWYITCSLIRHNWPDDLIVALLTDKSYACTAHIFDQSNPTQYAISQVRKAKDAVDSDWQRTKEGQISAGSQINIRKALTKLGVRFGHNEFEGRSYMNGIGPKRLLNDTEVNGLRLTVDSKFDFMPGKELFFDVVSHIAHETTYNPVAMFLDKNEPTWDGVRRIGDDNTPSWLTTYGGAEDNPYTRAVGRLTLLAAVRRIRQPGCKHDEMLVLVSAKQGTNKSSALSALAVHQEWFSDSFPLHAKDKQVIEYLQGKWIVECGELTGIRQAQLEETKALLSRQVDHARLAYDRLANDFPRRCIVIGTTNTTEFLRDMQNRRYWPVTIIRFDLEALKHDVKQIWAEAAQAETAGEPIQLAEELWPIAADVQEDYRIDDPWADVLSQHLDEFEHGRILGTEIWKILQKQEGMRQTIDAARIGDVMRTIGWTRKQMRFPGMPKPKHGYYRGCGKPTLYANIDERGDVLVSPVPDPGTYESARDATTQPEPPPF